MLPCKNRMLRANSVMLRTGNKKVKNNNKNIKEQIGKKRRGMEVRTKKRKSISRREGKISLCG